MHLVIEPNPFKMKNQLFIIFSILLFIQTNSIGQTPLYQKGIPEDVRILCNEIAKENTVMDKFIGKSMQTPIQWKNFEQLQKKSSEEVLLKLTIHEDPVIRVYAFWGLINRRSDSLVSALRKNKDTTIEVEYFKGCIKTSVILIDLVIYKVRKENIGQLNSYDRKYIKSLIKRAKERSVELKW